MSVISASENDECLRLVYWTQYSESRVCWFISILITIFYSEENKKLLSTKISKWRTSLKKSDFEILKTYGEEHAFNHIDNFVHDWDNILHSGNTKLIKSVKNLFRVQLYNVFKHVNKSHTLDHDFFRKYNTEYILMLLNFIEPRIFGISNLSLGFETVGYIKQFYEFLNIRPLMFLIAKYKDTEVLCYHDDNHINKIVIDEETEVIRRKVKYHKPEYISRQLETTPEVLIVNIDYTYNIVKLFKNHRHYILKRRSEDVLLRKNVENLLSRDEIIEFNNNQYVLDAIILTDYNKSEHVIAGIKCNGRKYIYEGTEQAELIGQGQRIACPLTPYRWNAKDEKRKFCFRSGRCGVESINSATEVTYTRRKQCYSFAKGDMSLIYVKTSNPPSGMSIDNSHNSFSSALSKISLNSEVSLGEKRQASTEIYTNRKEK